MLDQFDEVVTKLNLLECHDSSSKNVAKVPKINASNNELNNVMTFNVNHNKSNEVKCLFCGKFHKFWKCDTVKASNARLSALKSKHPNNCIKCGQHHPKHPRCH